MLPELVLSKDELNSSRLLVMFGSQHYDRQVLRSAAIRHMLLFNCGATAVPANHITRALWAHE